MTSGSPAGEDPLHRAAPHGWAQLHPQQPRSHSNGATTSRSVPSMPRATRSIGLVPNRTAKRWVTLAARPASKRDAESGNPRRARPLFAQRTMTALWASCRQSHTETPAHRPWGSVELGRQSASSRLLATTQQTPPHLLAIRALRGSRRWHLKGSRDRGSGSHA